MGFNITYKRLFQVEIRHDYLLNRDGVSFLQNNEETQVEILAKTNNDVLFDIYPTAACQERMKLNNLIFRKTPSGFFVGVKSDENGQNPFVPLEEYVSLLFAITPRTPFLTNLTNYYLEENAAKKTFYLTNGHQTSLDDKRFLSSPIRVFDAGDSYFSGDIVETTIAATPTMFEAEENNPGNPIPTNQKWHEIPFQPYVHRQDRIPVMARIFRLDFSLLNINQASLVLKRAGDNQEVLNYPISYEDDSRLGNFLVEIPNVPEGKYTMSVLDSSNNLIPDLSGEVMLSDELASSQVFGVVDMLHCQGLGDFRLLEADGSLRKLTDASGEEIPLSFYAHFRNRHTFWRYIYNKKPVNNAADIDNDYAQEDIDLLKFVSRKTKPLTQVYQTTQVVKNGAKVPNPDVRLLKPNKQTGRIISEVYIQI